MSAETVLSRLDVENRAEESAIALVEFNAARAQLARIGEFG